jgi:LPS sulfotransferase NodH
MPYVKFVVLTSSRTGSTWLIDLLNMQPKVEAHGELFLEQPRSSPAMAGRADYRRFIEVHGVLGLARAARVFSYLTELYRGQSTIGFKLMYSQLRRHPEIFAFMAFRRLRVVHLTRRNHIDVIISEELAKVTGASHAQVGKKTDVPMVYLDPTTLVDRIRRRNRKPKQARCLIWLSACPSIEVTYEALLEEKQEFARILDFLGIACPTTQKQSNLVKRGARSHRDAIANYDEVSQVLKSTPFSNMLR